MAFFLIANINIAKKIDTTPTGFYIQDNTRPDRLPADVCPAHHRDPQQPRGPGARPAAVPVPRGGGLGCALRADAVRAFRGDQVGLIRKFIVLLFLLLRSNFDSDLVGIFGWCFFARILCFFPTVSLFFCCVGF